MLNFNIMMFLIIINFRNIKLMATKQPYWVATYRTLFHPHLAYCISARSSIFSIYPNILLTVENKAMKLIERLSP